MQTADAPETHRVGGLIGLGVCFYRAHRRNKMLAAAESVA
jgi:hypothetical protein